MKSSVSLVLLIVAIAMPSVQAQNQASKTAAKQQSPTAHFLRQGEEGYSTRVSKVSDRYPLPIPPGATPGLAYQNTTDKGNTGDYLRLHSPHSRSELIDWYIAQLKSLGWKVDQPLPSGPAMTMSAVKPNVGSATLSFLPASPPETGCDILTNVRQ